MANETPQTTTLQTLIEKYGKPDVSPRESAQRAFEVTSHYAQTQRVSKSPTSTSELKTGDIHAEMAGIQMDLAELAERYGKLNVGFSSLVGKNRVLGVSDLPSIMLNTLLMRRGRVRQIKIDAARRKGENIEYLVNMMSEVLNDQYQTALKGRGNAQRLQVENVSHMRKLDEALIQRLSSGYVGTADYALAQSEVGKLEAELKEIDATLGDYEVQVQNAKTSGGVELVKRLTGEMTQVLDIKYGVLDGKLASEGVVSEIRRKMLESAEGVVSAKNAAAASRVSYKAIGALIDSMSELEIKYRHALEDMVPVFKIQGKIASYSMQAKDMKDALIGTAKISQRLMEANVRIVSGLATEAFELLQTDLYDPQKAMESEARIDGYMDELNQRKVEWAEMKNRVSEIPNQPHYASPR